jgi:5'-nucleotidase
MRILVSNDDGVYSPGIACLAQVASRFGEVRVVAPDVEQSAAAHSISITRPVSYRPTPIFEEIEGYRVNGTPADCVALGLFLWDGVDVVLSGVNLGLNLGYGIWHSGTVAAAKQAALLGVRGIALSTSVGHDEPDFAALAPHVERVLSALLPITDLPLANVNLPPSPGAMRWTRQSARAYDGKVVPGADPMGREHYWFTVEPAVQTEPGTDLWAVEHGDISITPLIIDVTNHEKLERLRAQHPLDPLDPEAAP